MIIQSLLDTDLYKFTMMQVVLHHFPGAQVEYKFKCPEGVKSGKGVSTGDAIPSWSVGQEENVKELLDAMKKNDPASIAKEATATLITNVNC